MAVDRERRAQLIAAINRFLDEQTSAFDFDEEIHRIGDATTDQTVRDVVDALWLHYDDLSDHKVALCKLEWDYFQRLILLLKSDARLQVQKQHYWSLTQLAAAGALAAFLWCVALTGIGQHLLLVAIPFGLISVLISHVRRRLAPDLSQLEVALLPFASISQLLAIRRKVAEFSKRRYPTHLACRRIRSRLGEFAVALQTYSCWLLLSPLVLIFQMLPTTRSTSRVIC